MNSVKTKMVFPDNEGPCVYKQCELLELSRSSYYRQIAYVPEEDSAIIKESVFISYMRTFMEKSVSQCDEWIPRHSKSYSSADPVVCINDVARLCIKVE